MSVRYVVREGFSGFFRAKLAVVASIMAISLAIFLISVLARLGWNAYEVALTLKKSVEVELFLKESSDAERERLIKSLKKDKIVRSVVFISKDSAAAIFLNAFGAEGQALADLEFLPASLQIGMKETVKLAELDEAVKKWEKIGIVEELKYNRQLVELLEKRMESMLYLGGGFGLMILLIAVLLVFNTIRLTIYAKRNVIKAMKLVGATNSFVKRPFQVEGILQALLGSGLALWAHYLLFSKVIPYFIPQLAVLAWPMGDWVPLTISCIVLAVFMGVFGSSWALRTYLKKASSH